MEGGSLLNNLRWEVGVLAFVFVDRYPKFAPKSTSVIVSVIAVSRPCSASSVIPAGLLPLLDQRSDH